MQLDRSTMHKIYRIIAFAVLLYLAVQNINILPVVISWILRMVSPLLWGGALAFVLSGPVNSIERRLFSNRWKRSDNIRQNHGRVLSILIVLLILLAVIIGLFALVIPEFVRSLRTLLDSLPTVLSRVQIWLQDMSIRVPATVTLIDQLDLSLTNVTKTISDWITDAMDRDTLNTAIESIRSVTTLVFNFFMALIFGIYTLTRKEKLAAQGKKLLYAYLPEKTADSLTDLGAMISDTFSSFVTSQVSEAFILGILTFITNTIFGMPYSLVISVVVGVFALIPIFGALVGAVVGFVLVATVDPIKAVWFLVLNIILQQVEGNLIYPHTVGHAVGLPAMWVLAATIIGGYLGGWLGILLAIPIMSLIYDLVRGAVYKRLNKRKIPHYKTRS